MRRLFWLGLGAAAGYYVAKRSDAVVADVRDRGLVGNVTLAASTASRVAQSAGSTARAVAGQARAAASDRSAAPAPSPQPSPTRPSREVRP